MGKSNLGPWQNRTIAILGYSPDARAEAGRMREHDVRVIIGLREGDPLVELARQDGFTVCSLWGAVGDADIIQVW